MHFHHPLAECFDATDGVLVAKRDYFDVRPARYDFTGTDIADRHGGWDGRTPCVEFRHTLDQIMNAALSAGLRLLKIEEHSHNSNDPLSKLPSHVLLVWQKPK